MLRQSSDNVTLVSQTEDFLLTKHKKYVSVERGTIPSASATFHVTDGPTIKENDNAQEVNSIAYLHCLSQNIALLDLTMSFKYDYLKFLFSDAKEANLLEYKRDSNNEESGASDRPAVLRKVHSDCHARVKEYLKKRDITYSFTNAGMVLQIEYHGESIEADRRKDGFFW